MVVLPNTFHFAPIQSIEDPISIHSVIVELPRVVLLVAEIQFPVSLLFVIDKIP